MIWFIRAGHHLGSTWVTHRALSSHHMLLFSCRLFIILLLLFSHFLCVFLLFSLRCFGHFGGFRGLLGLIMEDGLTRLEERLLSSVFAACGTTTTTPCFLLHCSILLRSEILQSRWGDPLLRRCNSRLLFINL